MLPKKHPVLAAERPDLTTPIFTTLEDVPQDYPFLYYAQEDGRIACYIRSFPDISTYRGQKQLWSWNADLFCDPDFRRRGLAQALVEQQMQACDDLGMIWGGVFSSPPALRLYEKLGFTMVGTVPRLCVVRNITPFLAHHMPRPLAQLGNLFYRVLHAARESWIGLRGPRPGGAVLEEIQPDALADLPMETTCPSDVVHWDRDAHWVTRRFEIGQVDRVFVLKKAPSEPPLAYVTLRERPNLQRPVREKYFGIKTMTLTHVGSFAPIETTAPVLIAALRDRFRRSDADLLEVIAAQPAVQEAARAAGMIPLGSGMSFKYYAPEALKSTIPADGIRQFHLTHYSGDAFSFE